jgi:hypothetical protein
MGGDLTLHDRPAGGTVAELIHPVSRPLRKSNEV